MAAMLAGCAGYNDPYYVHSVWRSADGADGKSDVFFLTDRAPYPGTPGRFGYSPGDAPSCGVVHATVPAAKMPTGPALFAEETGNTPITCGAAQSGLAAAIAHAARSRSCNQVLVFVHGFDTGFRTAALRAAQLGIDTQWPCVVAAFSWSSSGKRIDYELDRKRSVAAEPLFAEFLRALAAAGLKTSIVAHSMGTQLTLGALGSRPDAATLADQVILAAADISVGADNDEFLTLYRGAESHVRHLTIYASEQDSALAVSRGINHGHERLGHSPDIALRDGMTDVDVIDASDAPGGLTGHDYYGLSYETLADMSLALADEPAAERLKPRGGQPPTLLPGEDGLPYRLNVTDGRAPGLLTRILRWLITTIAG
jgi:esterase/lipase superfamily enzyme